MPRRQLGRELRRLREEAGIQVSAAAQALEWSGPKLWRIEKGMTSMRSLDVEAMCRLYGADDRMTEALKQLALATKDRGWWHAHGDTVPEWFELYMGLEQASSGLRSYEPELVPGLLQTADYAKTVIRVGEPKLPDEELDKRVRLRMTRQQLLDRTIPAAPRLDVILGEAVLHRLPQDTAREQLDQLLKMASKPGISISLLPSRGLHRAVEVGSFTILDFPMNGGKPSEPTVVYSQGLTGALYLDKEHEISRFEEVWASIADEALSGDDFHHYISNFTEEVQ